MDTQGKVSHSNKDRLRLLKPALGGDAQAQYELGESYCCGESGFWSTEEASKWWCKAAMQGHDEAKKRLVEKGLSC